MVQRCFQALSASIASGLVLPASDLFSREGVRSTQRTSHPRAPKGLISMALALGAGFSFSFVPNALTSKANAQTADGACVMVAADGRSLDLSRLCGASPRFSDAPSLFVTTPIEVPPSVLPIPNNAAPVPIAPSGPSRLPSRFPNSLVPVPQGPSYGVIFLTPMSKTPTTLSASRQELAGKVGNASPGVARNITIVYEISVPTTGGGHVVIGQGTKVVGTPTLPPGQSSFFTIHRSDVRNVVPVTYRESPELSVRVTAIGWRGADGKVSSFGPDSYRLARGVGQCSYTWERDAQGQRCR